MSKTISILGATGSIGRQTLDVAEQLGLRVAALTAHMDVERLEAQVRKFRPRLAVLTDEAAARDLAVRLADMDTKVLEARRPCWRPLSARRRTQWSPPWWVWWDCVPPCRHPGEKAHRPGQQGDVGLRRTAGDGCGGYARRRDRACGLGALGHLPVPSGLRRLPGDPAADPDLFRRAFLRHDL